MPSKGVLLPPMLATASGGLVIIIVGYWPVRKGFYLDK